MELHLELFRLLSTSSELSPKTDTKRFMRRISHRSPMPSHIELEGKNRISLFHSSVETESVAETTKEI